MNVYDWADKTVNAAPNYETGFTELLSTQPYRMSSAVLRSFSERFQVIRSFQHNALDIFRAAIMNELDPKILHWLINETPGIFGIDYHRCLEDRHFTLPVFFRTDEVKPGKLSEIQCPGSLWGELQLLFEYAARLGYRVEDHSPADQFATQLIDFLNEAPLVHHFLDKASAPTGMRYFIEKTRPRVKYWGIDHGVKISDCNFIRHHTVIELWTDDNFHARLSKVGNGLTYDCPPYMLFDQKAPLALPFWSLTREFFLDEIRNLFPYTTPLLPSGIELPDGRLVSIEEFSRFPKSERSYYLKLAGFNTELNWGSRAVYRLSNMGSEACLHFLRQCLYGFENGQVWLLQKEEFQEDEITYLTRDGNIHTQKLRAKFSGFYAPGGCLGVVVMHRHNHKVHGQDETVISYVISEDEVPIRV